MERKIGEIFEYNGEWYQCVEDTERISCTNCCFYNGGYKSCTNESVGFCTLGARSDGISVIFKKLEDVGEPITIKGRTFQKLILDNCSCADCVFNVQNKECYKNSYIDGPCPEDEIWVEIKQNKEDTMEEKKLNLKPFDIQKAREGKPVCTRNGRKARIICFDAKCADTPIVALVTRNDGEILFRYYRDGRLSDNKDSVTDLMMLPEKKEGWANIYRSQIYNTLEKAKEAYKRTCNDDNYLQTIKIEWEE